MDNLDECAICLQNFLYPVTLPCKHSFCYLCVKGIRSSSVTKKCALCREDFTLESIEQEVAIIPESLTSADDQVPRWLYSGKFDNSGWWQYDEINSSKIESDFQVTGNRQTEINISGFLYIIDFDQMIQYRNEHPERHRRIKRETRLKNVNIKGIAGLRLQEQIQQLENTANASENENSQVDEISDMINNLDINPNSSEISSPPTENVENTS